MDFGSQVGAKLGGKIEPRQAKTGQDKGRQGKRREGKGKEEEGKGLEGKGVEKCGRGLSAGGRGLPLPLPRNVFHVDALGCKAAHVLKNVYEEGTLDMCKSSKRF